MKPEDFLDLLDVHLELNKKQLNNIILSGNFNLDTTKNNNIVVVFHLKITLKLFEIKVGNDIKPTRDMETKLACIDIFCKYLC